MIITPGGVIPAPLPYKGSINMITIPEINIPEIVSLNYGGNNLGLYFKIENIQEVSVNVKSNTIELKNIQGDIFFRQFKKSALHISTVVWHSKHHTIEEAFFNSHFSDFNKDTLEFFVNLNIQMEGLERRAEIADAINHKKVNKL